MKKIALSQNKFALVDDEDFEKLNKFKWCAQRIGNTFYATCRKNNKIIYMHREIIKCDDDLVIDHKNRNGLDNQKLNLRLATKSLNGFNTKIRKNNKSGFTGIHWNKRNKNWCAVIHPNKSSVYVGSFSSIKMAVKARQIALGKIGVQALNLKGELV